jgi:prolyl oligopeptidase
VVKDVVHGVTIEDGYRWLEDGKSAEVKAWMTAQDEYARNELKKLKERESLAARLKELFYIDSVSAPIHLGKRYFYGRRLASKEKGIVYYREGKDGAENVLFDPNEWTKDGSESLGNYVVSWDGKTVAYTIHKNNSDEATLYVMDVGTKKKSSIDVIEGARYAQASWTPKGDGFYYTWLPTDKSIKESDLPGFAEVRFHKLGDDPKKDRIVREKTGDPSVFLSADLSRDGHFLQINVYHGWTSSDLYLKDMRKPNAEALPVVVGKQAHYDATVYKDQLYIKTDEGASRGRVFRVDTKKLAREDWKEIIPESPDETITGTSILGGKIVITYLKNATEHLRIHALDGKLEREIALPGLGTLSGPVGLSDEDEAYFGFQSFTMPTSIQSFSVKSGETKLYYQVKVPVDPSPYLVEQVFYPSKDGTKISMFIVRRKDMKRDGSNRTYLYGYGGFQSNVTSTFIASLYPWLERGGVYATPNLRGGAEYGEAWHTGGMREKKQNVFDDFTGAAEYLIKEGYTKPEKLIASGGSNGGLLVGAAMTQRPDLFAGIICGVPLLDMVRYHQFGAGKTWISEYGSADTEAEFKWLYAYSPYHHITQGTKYPALLMMSADADDRVDPMHARKFVAAIQAASTGGPAYLRVEKNSGHGGADLVRAEVDKGVDRFAFALDVTK